jgi:hypothetical protein
MITLKENSSSYLPPPPPPPPPPNITHVIHMTLINTILGVLYNISENNKLYMNYENKRGR